MPVRKFFSALLFNSIECFVQYPFFALPHFLNIEAFLLCMVLYQGIELSLLFTTLKIFFTEGKPQFLTGTEMAKATQAIGNSVAKRTKPINTETVNYFLSACCKEAFSFTFWSCSLKKERDHVFKAAGLFCRHVNLPVPNSRSQRV